MERLETVWAAVEDDRRQVVFVGGEPGVGKTRLAAEVAAALREHGATVLWGSCREEFNTPYQPFVAILEQALEQSPTETLRDITPQAAAPLLRLTTSALGPWPEASSFASGDGDSRPVLFDAVLRVLLAVAEQAPTVLILEDLHWAPEPALAMLTHLVESTAGEQLLVLATRRTTAPDRTDTVSFALADLHRLDGVARIDLVGLTTEDVAEYLVREAGVSPSSARAAAPVLRDHTGGNPFFLQEYWYDLASRGGLATVRSGNAQAPGSVQDALARRLGAFDLAHTRVLELAAVAGDVVDPALLVQACDLGADAVLEGIDLAVRAGLLSRGCRRRRLPIRPFPGSPSSARPDGGHRPRGVARARRRGAGDPGGRGRPRAHGPACPPLPPCPGTRTRGQGGPLSGAGSRAGRSRHRAR